MSRYLGFVTIMVNVASEWGLTEREYTQLQGLYEKYQKDGLRIVAFPSNEFGNQEPGDNSVIKDFVTKFTHQYCASQMQMILRWIWAKTSTDYFQEHCYDTQIHLQFLLHFITCGYKGFQS